MPLDPLLREADFFSIASAIYWYCNDYHEGGGSRKYQILSTMGYNPGALEKGPQPDSMDSDIYDGLVAGDIDLEVALRVMNRKHAAHRRREGNPSTADPALCEDCGERPWTGEYHYVEGTAGPEADMRLCDECGEYAAQEPLPLRMRRRNPRRGPSVPARYRDEWYRAFVQGMAAGRRGQGCPHPAGSVIARVWAEGRDAMVDWLHDGRRSPNPSGSPRSRRPIQTFQTVDQVLREIHDAHRTPPRDYQAKLRLGDAVARLYTDAMVMLDIPASRSEIPGENLLQKWAALRYLKPSGYFRKYGTMPDPSAVQREIGAYLATRRRNPTADGLFTEEEFEAFGVIQPKAGGYFEHEDVKGKPLHKVWTVVEGDDDALYASPGFHVVNKLGYLLTRKPWTDATKDAVWMEPTEGFRAGNPSSHVRGCLVPRGGDCHFKHERSGGAWQCACPCHAGGEPAPGPSRDEVDRLASRFIAELQKEIGPKKLALVVRRNRDRARKGDSSSCASHDFCDANMAMADAFASIYHREPITPSDVEADASMGPREDRDLALFNAAWTRAKAVGFDAKKL